ncbi:MAG: isoleucine--tRNA ligase [Bacteroidales bacterium]|nr:isoleucine--tRNA ligase [Bacteroidales bacterium]
MSKKFPEYKGLDLSEVNKSVLDYWDENDTFHKSIRSVNDKGRYIFYEGPPSANGKPGIHHVMARAIKDTICRYKTQCGYEVKRKAGWDTHGLPVELGVEKSMGITKEDIGKSISVEDYNKACRVDVMKYTDLWVDLTRKMGYWVNMDDPYVTYDNRYIETLWWLLRQLYDKGFLYKGYTIQPYSPAAGTGLSSHELNLPGCYKDVKDTTATALFKIRRNDKSEFLYSGTDTTDVHFIAWTTTPWTLPSNTGLVVGEKITYAKIRSFNPYTGDAVTIVMAKDLIASMFNPEGAEMEMDDYNKGDKKIPYRILDEFPGSEMVDIKYEQLINWINPGEGAFRVVSGDFVTTEEGTGIVHIAPTFGADDQKVGREHNIPGLMVKLKDNFMSPLVDRQGRMVPIEDMDPEYVSKYVNMDTYPEFAGRYVKNEYSEKLSNKDETLDIDISVRLKQEGKAFKVEKHMHNYPHCWRTDKPVLYYPLDSWFIRTTALRERMIELNNTINWKPASTGTGRFGRWLENLVDWNLSRSRYWGTPLPIWVTEDKTEEICIGSVAELKKEIDRSVEAGFMKENPLKDFNEGDTGSDNYESFDLHRPFVDDITLVSGSGKPMKRETDLIDVWFDSGAMPYAQHHYPFNKDIDFDKFFPADFIAEGVDQTRGWFFTLHAIAAMISDSVSFKNIISNGLVLDKNGNKMSKRLGNAVDPFEAIEQHGSDPLRWYMLTNAQPWDNLKFDMSGVDEVKRKFFGTLYNTYSFFALYANIDGFVFKEDEVPMDERQEIDRWIISLLNSLTREVSACYEDYDITRAARAIQDFVTEDLSNWYVRLNRKRYWGGDYNRDKVAAYQTLFTCLDTVSRIAAPIAPFYMERLFNDLNKVAGRDEEHSVHLTLFPLWNDDFIDEELEKRMQIAQKVSSMVLGLRRKVSIKVRQPLSKIMIPLTNDGFKERFEAVKDLILSEVNVKDVEYIEDTSGILVKKIKPNFKALGPRYGKMMKQISATISKLDQDDIAAFEKEGNYTLNIDGQEIILGPGDVEIISEDIPGWLVANEGSLTVALDVTVSDELKEEGVAREFINRIQNLRKDSGFDVTDKIHVVIENLDEIAGAVKKHSGYIGSQTLADHIELASFEETKDVNWVDIDDKQVRIKIRKA